MLAIGDYTFERGQNKSFLEDSDDPISWKRLLRGELHQGGRRRGYVKELLDRIDVKTGVRQSLDEVIRTTAIAEDWRRLLVESPKLMEFCARRQIRLYSNSSVYLLKGVRRSGEHADLFSYQLYLGMLSGKFARGEMAPFRAPSYNTVHTDSLLPSVTLACNGGNAQLTMQIWNNGGRYGIRLFAEPGDLPAALKQELEAQSGCTVGTDGNPRFDVEMDKVEGNINSFVAIVRKHVPG